MGQTQECGVQKLSHIGGLSISHEFKKLGPCLGPGMGPVAVNISNYLNASGFIQFLRLRARVWRPVTNSSSSKGA
jgi:hypothetical protein